MRESRTGKEAQIVLFVLEGKRERDFIEEMLAVLLSYASWQSSQAMGSRTQWQMTAGISLMAGRAAQESSLPQWNQ